MNQPSEEAVLLANKIYRQIAQGDDDFHDDCMNSCATMIEDHTAALRAEVEALRAERAQFKEWLGFKFAAANKTMLALLDASGDTGYYDGVLSAFDEALERLLE